MIKKRFFQVLDVVNTRVLETVLISTQLILSILDFWNYYSVKYLSLIKVFGIDWNNNNFHGFGLCFLTSRVKMKMWNQ